MVNINPNERMDIPSNEILDFPSLSFKGIFPAQIVQVHGYMIILPLSGSNPGC